MKRITVTVLIALFVLLGIAGCNNVDDISDNIPGIVVSDAVSSTDDSEFSDIISDESSNESIESASSESQPIVSESVSDDTETDESSAFEGRCVCRKRGCRRSK